jgi:serine/threonine-protein kinase
MTPERWRQVGDLFEAAMQVEPESRDSWLRAACAGDNDLRMEVSRLLAQDECAERRGFLTPPEATVPLVGRTGSWSPRAGGRLLKEYRPGARGADVQVLASGGFTPTEAIARNSRRNAVSEPPSVVRARLRELPVVYFLILGGAALWRHAILGNDDEMLSRVDVATFTTLAGLLALLWSRLTIPLVWLKALELGMIGVLACRGALVQYHLTLIYSLRDDRMMAQLCVKNMVLWNAVLILTYGLYVPKSWRRAAVGVWPLAVLPFATLGAQALLHSDTTGWLWEGWKLSTTPRVLLLGFDALVLTILALCSTYGAHTISGLRREVAKARQLGQYRLLRRIGAGGMGEVYLAEHQLLKRPCALKLIQTSSETEPNALERFEREVRLTATLSHPNTVEIYDYGRAEDGTYYYVMEYLPGLSLEDLVERHGPLPPGRAVHLLRQVCGALGEAHRARLIHRDIKPSNIFAARRGGVEDVAKLLDFGLVRSVCGPSSAHISAEGHVVGTPLFMSPEQATGGHELDERSDIYSLGAVAYYVLTGRPPFEGDSGVAVMIGHARDPVLPLSQARPGIPDDLEQVVLRCLAKHPADRFPNVEVLELALAECGCAGDWDQARAVQWWRTADLAPAMGAAVG